MNKSGTAEDRRAAANQATTLSGLVIGAALAALGAEAAVFIFVIDKRTHLLPAYILSGAATLVLVASIIVGGVAISQVTTEGGRGNWTFKTPRGEFSKFNAQTLLVLAGAVLVIASVFTGTNPKH